jgi:hypothetical protein
MLDKARQAMEAGATGLIFGRNVWQREHTESLRFVTQLRDILAKYPSRCSLASGELRAKITSAPEPSSPLRSRSVIVSSSRPLTTRIPQEPMPTRRAIAAAVSPLSPVTL